MTEFKKFAKSLKSPPGVPVASAFVVFGFIFGALAGDDWLFSGMRTAEVMCIYWIPVLWTAWTNRNNA